MSEFDRLFPTRAQRFPNPDDSDLALKALETGLDLIPTVGPIIKFVTSNFIGPSFERRRSDWLKELADAFEELERRDARRFKEALNDEAFLTAVYQASRIAVTTHQHQKRMLLKNALMNIAEGLFPEDDLQHIYIGLIDDLTVSHIRLLRFIWRGAGDWNRLNNSNSPPFVTVQVVLEALEPAFKGKADFVAQLGRDLNYAGLSNFGRPTDTFPGANLPNYGIQFMNFVVSPDDRS